MAINMLEMYLWYLVPKTSIFWLFSDRPNKETKTGIGAKLFSLTPPSHDNLERQEFPTSLAIQN